MIPMAKAPSMSVEPAAGVIATSPATAPVQAPTVVGFLLHNQSITIQVTDEQMAHAAERFPINPPRNKEEYYYRSIFAEHFPSDSAARSVPSVPSVACSTAEALAWDKAFKNMNDPSGRAVAGVHEKAY